MPKAEQTVIEINLNALTQNFNFLKSKLEPDTRFLAVVKAFGYGSDAVIVSSHLEKLGADYLAVAFTSEGVHLRQEGIKLPILVLHPQITDFKTIIDYCLEPNLYSFRVLESFIETCTELDLNNYPVHIKFNTGLNRLGFRSSDIKNVSELLKNGNYIKVRSIFSHLAASDDLLKDAFTRNQIEDFQNIFKELTDNLGYRPIQHILNTSGILNYPEAQFDMVRSGIGLYGFGNSPLFKNNLTPIITVKSIISQIHEIEPGESVGYNFGFVSDTYRRTATIPIGHADGIGRQYGQGKGYVTINEERAIIVGNVCMDMLMVDVTNINCEEGDEVVVFGQFPDAEEFSSTADTISYELLTGLSRRIKRIVNS
ncbi:alanine racemase [Aegicerativicinus sediminis]|uniref:alanine racemase n=1 Tax=Aegicerativicinus sediminis TaxID=2893202 RepID=UPI001E5A42E7|nr:alanine racemase [Aegicerativicinus sediminis]